MTAAGTGVEGAIVYVFDAGTAAYAGNAFTDATGAYSVSLPSGTYNLWVQTNTRGLPRPGLRRRRLLRERHRHRPHHRQPDRRRRAGRGSGRHRTISGTVTAAGTGVEGAIVYVFDAAHRGLRRQRLHRRHRRLQRQPALGHLQPVGPDQHARATPTRPTAPTAPSRTPPTSTSPRAARPPTSRWSGQRPAPPSAAP